MQNFWYFFIHKRSFSYLILVALALAGIFSLVTIPKESSPEVRVPVGIVTTIIPGASPEDVERLVTNEIEEQLQGNLPDVRTITSVSSEGVSNITAEFAAEADLDSSIQDLRDEVSKVIGELPSDAETPIVSEVNFADQPILTFAISGDLAPRAFTPIADTIENEVERIAGVSRVSVSGLADREVRILVDQSALARFGISILDVTQAIRNNNAQLPVGTITLESIDYAVTFEGKLERPEDLLSVAIVGSSGNPIFLRDVAEIQDDFAEQVTLSRISIDGEPSQTALTFDVYKRQGGDITTINEQVRDRLDQLQAEGGSLEGLEVLVMFDTGDLLIEDLVNLASSGVQAIILVVLLLLLTLGWREAIIAGSAIPISFLVAFIGLEYSGNTINFVSLFSLILAIGILVDAAIVMVEGIHSNMKEWMDKEDAAKTAIATFQWPLIAGTFTTIAVFAPLFLISGITGQFIANIPFTIITVLLASLFVALGIIPVISSVVLRRRTTSHLEELQESYTKRFQNWYREHLDRVLESRTLQRIVMWGSVAAFLGALALPMLGLVQVEFFPVEDSDYLFVEMELPEGTVLERSDITIRRVEEILYQSFEEAEIDSFVTTVGASNAFSGASSQGERLANIFLILDEDRGQTSTEILGYLREQLRPIKEATIRVSQPSGGPPVGDPVVITLTSANIADLETAVVSAKRLVEDIEGTVDVRSSLEEDSTQFALSIDRARAAQLGVSPLSVAQTLRTAVFGTDAATLKVNGEDIDVVVKLKLDENAALDPLAAIGQMSVQTSQGSILLSSLLTTTAEKGSNAIRHEDGKRIATISSALEEGGNAIAVLAEFEARGAELNLPDTASFETGGENEDAEQAFQDMFRALVIGLVGMLAILVVQFNSFRFAFYVLSIVPLSLVGVFLGLLITGNPVSFPSMMGFIALMGIVVNNSIILIDVMNSIRANNPNKDMKDVVLEGSVSRLRPIILTAVTTIFGVIPLIFASEIWGPLAYALMFGLAFSVLITLILIPVIYYRWPGRIR